MITIKILPGGPFHEQVITVKEIGPEMKIMMYDEQPFKKAIYCIEVVGGEYIGRFSHNVK